METVLREDREALRSMQKQQPRFTEEQKRELSHVHPWIRTGRVPRAINISVRMLSPPHPHTHTPPPPLRNKHQSCLQGCKGCKSPPVVPPDNPFDVEIHEMELCGILSVPEDGKDKKVLSEILMEDADEEEAVEEKTAPTQDESQDMRTEEDAGTDKLDMNQ